MIDVSDIAVFLGLDVGKGEHHATAVTPAWKEAFDRRLHNSEPKLREVFGKMQAKHGSVLVVVDQPASIGALPLAVARDIGYTTLATRRQLRPMGLWPRGQAPVARIECSSGERHAWLCRLDLAKPVRPMPLVEEAPLDKAMAARQTGPLSRRRYVHCLPLKTLGSCQECHDGTPADPKAYVAQPVQHLLVP
ncbi:RRQRL motif-containing zinc-binding protein [Streptomyces sp. AA1529]|uniref:RRQRL motif-containing zinc-binding protein n=1 Tax=Streptomyces sp. AA1529 TaxID=1203257 RepID=UPI003D73C2CE